jgi:hypothetical protein
MNCRQGDLAIVIGGRASGMMVTCLELLAAGARVAVLGVHGKVVVGSADRLWRLDRRIPFEYVPDGSTVYADVANDDFLKPIRPGDTEHERDEAELLA